MKRIIQFFQDIPQEVEMTKREFLLTVAVSVLAGMVFGMFFSPRKTQVVGSYNSGLPDDETDEDDD